MTSISIDGEESTSHPEAAKTVSERRDEEIKPERSTVKTEELRNPSFEFFFAPDRELPHKIWSRAVFFDGEGMPHNEKTEHLNELDRPHDSQSPVEKSNLASTNILQSQETDSEEEQDITVNEKSDQYSEIRKIASRMLSGQ
jgi:hypothetical protein